MGFLNDLGRNLASNAKSELQYEINRGVRQGMRDLVQGSKKAFTNEWKCSCGAKNTGKFCTNCGRSKEAGVVVCKKCGWKSSDSTPKFCPECGSSLEDTADNSDSDVHRSSQDQDVDLSNLHEHLKAVPEDLERRIVESQTLQPGQTEVDYLRNMMSIAKDARNLTMDNLSTMTKAVSNTTRQAGGCAAADKLDEFAQDVSDIAVGKYDKK